MSKTFKTIVSKNNNWINLCSLLSSFGVENNDNEVVLNWNQPESDQLEFITCLMSKVTNRNVTGDYDVHPPRLRLCQLKLHMKYCNLNKMDICMSTDGGLMRGSEQKWQLL